MALQNMNMEELAYISKKNFIEKINKKLKYLYKSRKLVPILYTNI